jgi:hypothetical protein
MGNNVESSYPCRFDISTVKGGYRVTFYCITGDKRHTVEVYHFHTIDQVLKTAWNESKKYFNRCHQCGVWVCDEHYNEDVMKCIFCQPK